MPGPGAIAQLVERFVRIEEVRSSNLLSSTFCPVASPWCRWCGELLARTTPLRWVIAEDSLGRELALHAEQNNMLVYPLNAVEKRWVRGEDGDFIPALATAVYKQLGRLS
jgi:hypothetical protein